METPQTNTSPGRINWIAVIAGLLLDQVVSELIRAIGTRFDPELSVQPVRFATTAGIITACLLVVSTGLGGWLAARLARAEFVLHGVLVGGMGLFLIVVITFATGELQGLGVILLQCVAIVVGGIGGWLSGRMQESRR